jgi:hypothetical protein
LQEYATITSGKVYPAVDEQDEKVENNDEEPED